MLKFLGILNCVEMLDTLLQHGVFLMLLYDYVILLLSSSAPTSGVASGAATTFQISGEGPRAGGGPLIGASAACCVKCLYS